MLFENNYEKVEDWPIDINKIHCTITEPAPIVILYGPTNSGKTMALLRMIRFWEYKGYRIEADRYFRPCDMHYQRICDNLLTMAHSYYAPSATDNISFLLAKILDNKGDTICQILEAPGEHYFDRRTAPTFPTYIEEIIAAQNRRTWVFFLEIDWGGDRVAYTRKIRNMANRLRQSNRTPDKVVFLCNQIDRFPTLHNQGYPNMKAIANVISNDTGGGQYPNIFNEYKNGCLASLIYGRGYTLVPFSAGDFYREDSGNVVWIPGTNNWYCERLWDAIK